MQENYLISIVGLQHMGDSSDKVEITTLGDYAVKGDTHVITYKEYESSVSGSPVTSVLQVDENTVTLMRSNSETHRLVLEQGKRHLCAYETDYGNLTLGIFTNSVHSALGKDGGKLKISYTLDIGSGYTLNNEVFVTVKEVNGKDVKISTACN